MLAVAERVFTKRGYHAASMDEIAEACGVTKPMLYAYFGNKEGLFAACGVPAGERLRARIDEIAGDASGPPDERLWQGLLAIFRRIDENRETWLLLYPPDAPPPSGALGARAAMNRAAMTELVARLMRDEADRAGVTGDAAEQVTPLAHAVVGATLAMVGWWLKRPDEPAELQALRVMNLVWRGLERLTEGDLWLPSAEGAS
jgi:AcrR family transcriptional regulator